MHRVNVRRHRGPAALKLPRRIVCRQGCQLGSKRMRVPAASHGLTGCAVTQRCAFARETRRALHTVTVKKQQRVQRHTPDLQAVHNICSSSRPSVLNVLVAEHAMCNTSPKSETVTHGFWAASLRVEVRSVPPQPLLAPCCWTARCPAGSRGRFVHQSYQVVGPGHEWCARVVIRWIEEVLVAEAGAAAPARGGGCGGATGGGWGMGWCRGLGARRRHG